MKKHLSTILLVFVLLIGLSLLRYPTFSEYWNSFHQSRAIVNYTESVTQLDDASYDQVWADARAYNEALKEKSVRFYMDEEELAWYESLLNVGGNGIMGYIEIPRINCTLPIYHGTSEAVLQVAIGHIEGSSLPTGGAGTHCVVSGHRGLPSAKLFTNLDQMAEGDRFMLHVLDEVLTYEVDQILIVLPEEVEALEIDPEADFCTLVTCTPYGINTHRMLVRGHRVETVEEKAPVRVTADAVMIERQWVAPFVAAPIALILLIALGISTARKKR